MLNNRRLQAAYQELGLAQAALLQAGLLRNPVFDFERRFHADGNNKAMELAVMDDFLHILLIPLRRKLAAADLERAQSQTLAEILELSAQVQASFYRLQADAQVLQMRRTVLESAEASYELAQRMQKAGNLNDLAVAREQVASEQARLDLSSVERATIEDEFALGLKAHCWGYNGRTPGPTMEVVEADRVRIYVTNKLPEATTVHWHGVILPNGMDGVRGMTQPGIPPGETFRYEFAFPRPGTFMYHPHFDELTQLGMGLNGMIVVHPRQPTQPRPDRDFVITLNEFFIDPGASRPNTLVVSDFNLFTFNSKASPATEPLVARQGDRGRIRIGNLSAQDHHPIHIHGHSFWVVETDGGQIPQSAWWPETTVLVPVGAVRTIDFIADNPGDWAVHCHMTHHIMNQMGHNSPLLVGSDPGDLDEKVRRLLPGYMTMGQNGMGEMGEMPLPPNSIVMKGMDYQFGAIDMGGMVTVLKVRPDLTSYEDPGWYRHPDDTVARPATAQELRNDGIQPELPGTPSPPRT